MLQRQQQAAVANAAAAGGLQHRPPAKQNVAIARPSAGFSSAAVRPALSAPGAAQPAAKPPVSAADVIPAAKRKKRKLMDNRLPEKVKQMQIAYIQQTCTCPIHGCPLFIDAALP